MTTRQGYRRLGLGLLLSMALAGCAASASHPGGTSEPECAAPGTSTPGLTTPPAAMEPEGCGVTEPTPAAGSLAPGASASGSPEPTLLSVDARDLAFSPRQLAAPAHGSARIVLTDRGRIVHNLTIDELGVLVVTPPGRTAEQVVLDLPPGSYVFYCSISGHREAGMEGTLVVG